MPVAGVDDLSLAYDLVASKQISLERKHGIILSLAPLDTPTTSGPCPLSILGAHCLEREVVLIRR